MMAPGPCQLPSLTMVPPTNSQTCVVTLPGGGGSQPGVVPMMPFPMPTPAFMPPQVSGSQAPIIVAGTAQPQQTYPPYPPYAYPPQPQQPAQSNPLVETAAMTMMMQMIRAMLGTRTGGIRRRRPRPLMPMYPGDSPSLHVAISEGRRRSSALNRRKSSAATKGSEDAEGSKEEADKKSAKGGEEKDAQGKKAEMKGGGLKEPDGGAVRSGSGGSGSGNAVRSGSGGTSAGKGPDTNAPSLSLNFPSTTALGRHMPSSSDSDDTEYHFPFRCCCCFVLLAAAALACVILLAYKRNAKLNFTKYNGDRDELDKSVTESDGRECLDSGTSQHQVGDPGTDRQLAAEAAQANNGAAYCVALAE
ncbi:uncharacterized protein LOC144153304 [Haemaphysalis longicornis]